jgi:excisionase family DNA binding protein
MLAVSERTLWSLTTSGAIASVRIGRSLRYSVADLDAYVAAHRKGG